MGVLVRSFKENLTDGKENEQKIYGANIVVPGIPEFSAGFFYEDDYQEADYEENDRSIDWGYMDDPDYEE